MYVLTVDVELTAFHKLNFLSTHQWEEELLQSFVPTVLVSLLSLLIPLLLRKFPSPPSPLLRFG